MKDLEVVTRQHVYAIIDSDGRAVTYVDRGPRLDISGKPCEKQFAPEELAEFATMFSHCPKMLSILRDIVDAYEQGMIPDMDSPTVSHLGIIARAKSILNEPVALNISLTKAKEAEHTEGFSSNTSPETTMRIMCNMKAREMWSKFSENEKSAVRLGMLPASKVKAEIDAGYDSRMLAVALMDCAKADGGMIS